MRPRSATTTTTATATASVILGFCGLRLLVGIVSVVHLGHVGLGGVGVVEDGLRVVLADDASATSLHLQYVEE